MTAHAARQLDRLTFFSDAVFAIAITLLVIDVHVPHIGGAPDGEYLRALGALVPQFFGFAISFLVIGALWANHHRLFGLLRGYDPALLWPNLRMLMLVAFMPFATAFMASEPGRRVPAMFYAATLLMVGLLQMHLIARLLASTELAPEFTAMDRLATRYRSFAMPLVTALAMLAAWLVPVLCYLLCMLITPVSHAFAAWARRRAKLADAAGDVPANVVARIETPRSGDVP